MPKKKSVKKSARTFVSAADGVLDFVGKVQRGQSAKHVSWVHEYAILRLYRSFENLMLEALVGAINNDTGTLSARTGVDFPKHLTDEVCEYLVIGGGYFDFRGRDGLISVLKGFVPNDHYLIDVVKDPKYRATLNRLTALRNFAAHGSSVAKSRAKDVAGVERMASAGAWLKAGKRFQNIVGRLKELARQIESEAPY